MAKNDPKLNQPKTLAQLHEFYISGVIGAAEQYVQVFDIIRHASEQDTVKLYINSYGGDLFSAIQFMRVLAETEAHVVCSVEGICASAATFLFLAADSFEVTPHSCFLFHNYSGGTIGKGNEMYAQIMHERKWSERLLREIYADFLTEQEIQDLINGKDIWMDVDEVAERMKVRIAKYQETAEALEAEEE